MKWIHVLLTDQRSCPNVAITSNYKCRIISERLLAIPVQSHKKLFRQFFIAFSD